MNGIIMVVVVGVIAAAMASAIRFRLFVVLPLLVLPWYGLKFDAVGSASSVGCIAQTI